MSTRKEVPPWVWGVLAVLIMGIMLAALNDPGHHLPGTPGYGSPAPSASSSTLVGK